MTMRPFSELPARATDGGYVYLVKYSNDMVKVGYTQWPIKRFTALRRDADAFSIAVVEWWISGERPDYVELERRLLTEAESISGSAKQREYFDNLSFEEIRRRAVDITADPPASPPEGIPFDTLLEVASYVGDCDDRAHSLETVARWLQLPLPALSFNCQSDILAHVHYGRGRVMTLDHVLALCQRISPGGDLEGERFLEPLREHRRRAKDLSLRRDDKRRMAAVA